MEEERQHTKMICHPLSSIDAASTSPSTVSSSKSSPTSLPSHSVLSNRLLLLLLCLSSLATCSTSHHPTSSEPSSSTRDLRVDSHSSFSRNGKQEEASSFPHSFRVPYSSYSLPDEYLIPQQRVMDTDSLVKEAEGSAKGIAPTREIGESRKKDGIVMEAEGRRKDDDTLNSKCNDWPCKWKMTSKDEDEKKGEETHLWTHITALHDKDDDDEDDDESNTRSRTKRSPVGDGLHAISSFVSDDYGSRSSASSSSSPFPSVCGSLSSERTRTPGASGPTFLEHFTEQLSDPGGSVSLRCIASGHPLPQVTWLLDGMPVPDNSRFRTGDYVTRESVVVSYVNITSVTVQDGGLYECTACNEVSFVKHNARLKIFGPPLVRSMDNVTAVAGETFTFNCPVAGHPIDTIFWEKGNQKLPFNHRQKVFPNGTLILTEVDRDHDQGSYKCTAVGGSGVTDNSISGKQRSSSNVLHISVRVRPEIEPFSFPKSLHEGQRFNVLCSVTKGDSPVQIRWYKGARLLGVPPTASGSTSAASLSGSDSSPTELVGISTVHVTPYSSSLIFDSVRPEHRGNYTCEATNVAGTARQQATMIIHVPPKWVVEPKDTSVLRGKVALIDCQADGFPTPSVRWSKTDGLESIPASEFKPIISGQHMRVFQNGSLIINNVQTTDAASYMCQVSNGIGSGLSKVFKLSVHVAAHFKSKFRAETVRKGFEARLKCEAEGDKPLTISWLKDKTAFNINDDHRYELMESATKEGVTSEIVIRNADRRDNALFSCITSNSFGNDDTNIQLIMQEPPDIPSDVKLIQTDGRTAQVAWSPPYSGNSPVVNYVIQHKLLSDKWTDRGVLNTTVSGNENYAKLSNLKPVHEYSVRVTALNNLGRSEPSDPLVFKTDEEAPGGPPLHIKAVALSSKSLRVNWKPPREDLQFGFIKGYYVGYKVFGADSESFVYKTLEVDSPDFREECVLTGLKRFTKYAVTVQAYNSKGTGPASEIIEVQTLQNDPPNPPQIKVSSTTSSSIHLSWSVRSDDQHETPQVNGFVLHQRKVGSNSGHQGEQNTGDWEELKLPGDRTSHSFERLACGTKYQYYITAFNAIGKSDPSEIITTKTEGTPPLSSEKNSVVATNTTAATVYLDSWHDGRCPISSFEIQWRPKKSRGKWESLRVFPVEHKQPILRDLLPSTQYDLKIVAINEAGSTEASYTFTTSSLIRAPAIVLGNEASGISFGNSRLPLDISLLLPTTIAVVMVVLLIFVVRIWLLKKRQPPSNFYGAVYGSQSAYDSTTKSQNGAESVCLNDIGTSVTGCGVKKINGSDGNGGTCGGDSGCYPSPYEMTKLNGNHHESCNGLLERHTTPLKPNTMMSECGSGEPMYATVKRTPRAPRNDTHVYQYPLTIQGTFVSNGQESCFDTESCVSLTPSGVGAPTTTAYLRIHEDDQEKSLSAVPLLISEDGRQISIATLRRPLVGNHQQNFQR